MPSVIIAHEKHGIRVYGAQILDGCDADSLGDIAVILLETRYESGLYDEKDAGKIEEILGDNDGGRAWAFLLSRCDHEYESVERQEI